MGGEGAVPLPLSLLLLVAGERCSNPCILSIVASGNAKIRHVGAEYENMNNSLKVVLNATENVLPEPAGSSTVTVCGPSWCLRSPCPGQSASSVHGLSRSSNLVIVRQTAECRATQGDDDENCLGGTPSPKPATQTSGSGLHPRRCRRSRASTHHPLRNSTLPRRFSTAHKVLSEITRCSARPRVQEK